MLKGISIVLSVFIIVGCSSSDEPSSDTLETVPSNPKADVVYVNGKIYTVNEAQPWAESMVVKGSK
ncbi:MAG: hypothetical protein V7711_11920 [Pseudomonadales bacterium]